MFNEVVIRFLDFVRTLAMNVAKTEFSSSLSTNLADRF